MTFAEMWVFLLAIVAWLAVAVPVAVTIGRLSRLRASAVDPLSTRECVTADAQPVCTVRALDGGANDEPGAER